MSPTLVIVELPNESAKTKELQAQVLPPQLF
jgi:hypothetical protein